MVFIFFILLVLRIVSLLRDAGTEQKSKVIVVEFIKFFSMLLLWRMSQHLATLKIPCILHVATLAVVLIVLWNMYDCTT